MAYETAFEMAASNVRIGPGVTREVGMDLADMGVKRALVVTDPNLSKLPPVATVLESLAAENIEVLLFDRIHIEPTDVSFQEAIDFARQESPDALVADPLDPKVADEPMVMGPVVSAKAKRSILEMIQTGVDEGATLALDGRNLTVEGAGNGHFIGPTVFTDVTPGMKIHGTEIFGPVVVILKANSLDEAIGIINDHQYGNGASIYTQNGYYARKFKLETDAGMVGINVGIPAPVAPLPFGGMKNSLFADTKAQGRAVINFFTEQKIITERYWAEAETPIGR